jgi:hypothetical protein
VGRPVMATIEAPTRQRHWGRIAIGKSLRRVNLWLTRRSHIVARAASVSSVPAVGQDDNCGPDLAPLRVVTGAPRNTRRKRPECLQRLSEFQRWTSPDRGDRQSPLPVPLRIRCVPLPPSNGARRRRPQPTPRQEKRASLRFSIHRQHRHRCLNLTVVAQSQRGWGASCHVNCEQDRLGGRNA